MFRLTIPQPCHEQWDEMTPVEKGRYCKACSKTITDFSGMSDAEVLDRIANRNSEPLCGRFSNDQLNRSLVIISPAILFMDIPVWKKYLAILFICFSGLLTSCDEGKKTSTYHPLPDPPFGNTIRIDTAAVKNESKETAATNKNDQSGTGKKCIVPDENTSFTTGIIGIEPAPPVYQHPGPSLFQQLFGRQR